MIVALLIPFAAAALGVGLWFLLRGVGALNVPSADPGTGYGGGYRASTWQESRGGSFRERIDALPQGCLIAVIVVAGLWILGWGVALIIGLSLLT